MVECHINRSKQNDLLLHLQACDSTYIPALSSRVDLDEYSKKLYAKANRIEAWENGSLIGIVAAYVNQPPRAFISDVSVNPSKSGEGIARMLIDAAIRQISSTAGFHSILLEVNESNERVISLYKSVGFVEVSRGRDQLNYELTL